MVEFKRILVPLDGSELSERSLPLAMSLARKYEAELILLQVVDITPAMAVSHPHISASWLAAAREEARQAAQQYLASQQEALREQGYNARFEVHETAPADGIIDVAEAQAVDIIVMSTHGRSGLARWTFGSVADKVARHSPCPVLLVRKGAELQDADQALAINHEAI